VPSSPCRSARVLDAGMNSVWIRAESCAARRTVAAHVLTGTPAGARERHRARLGRRVPADRLARQSDFCRASARSGHVSVAADLLCVMPVLATAVLVRLAVAVDPASAIRET